MTSEEKYKPTWNSLKKHKTPEWLDDAKFGIYFHWGVYSVPACGPNGSWYPNQMYVKDSQQYKYHVENYGPPSEFGYKDLIPLFKAEKFDPDEWATLFKKAGAKFAGPVAEHHDGFSMWDSKVNKWNAAKMGPKSDIVGEIEKAIRKQDMKFLVAFHHAANWWYYPHWRKEYDTSDPEYSGLYGPIHNQDAQANIQWHHQDRPTKKFLDIWRAKVIEVIDNYKPDLIWWDFGLGGIHDKYKREVLAYYFNKAEEWNKEVEIFYKMNCLPPGVGIVDYELGRANKLTYHKWITDTSVDDIGAWSYAAEADYKSVDTLVHNFVDRIAKNGYLLLNVGPKANGEIPKPAKNCLLGIGKWLDVNSEAIFNTTPWIIAEAGPTKVKRTGMFSERKKVKYTPEDIRFVVKDNSVYAISLGWPDKQITIKIFRKTFKKLEKPVHSMGTPHRAIAESDIKSVKMLGVDNELEWTLDDDGLHIRTPDIKPCENAYVFKITRP